MLELPLLAQIWTPAGARDIWSTIVCQCVKSQHPDAREIRPNPGDEGVDTFSGELTGGSLIWQAKYFYEGIGDSQKKQIRESFNAAINSREINNILKWHLCIPIEMGIEENKWWEGWRKKKETEYGVSIVLWSRATFVTFFTNPRLTDMFRLAFNKEHAISPDAFKHNFIPAHTNVVNLDIDDKYDEAIFVKKLEAANVQANRAARTAFYNYELLKMKISESSDEEEKARLMTLYQTIYSIWEQEFNKRNSTEYGRKFYTDFLNVLKLNKRELDEILEVHRIHNEGAIHNWADDCHAGWIENFKIKIVEKP